MNLKKDELQIAAGVLLVAGVIFFLTNLLPRLGNPEAYFCRDIFAKMVQANGSAQRFIDWEKFTAIGVDVGTMYSAVGSLNEQQAFKRLFLENFAREFKAAGGKFSSFVHWRVYDSSPPDKTIVAVDNPAVHLTLLFTLSKGKERKVLDIRWQEEAGNFSLPETPEAAR